MSKLPIAVVGAGGALGRAFVKHITGAGRATAAIDVRPVETQVGVLGIDAKQPPADIRKELLSAAPRYAAVIHVAGTWIGGGGGDDDALATLDALYLANLRSASLAAYLSMSVGADTGFPLLSDDGLMVVTGASAALEPTPGMMAYGMVKAATHHMVESAAAEGSGLPPGATALAILPTTIDTLANRAAMPDADTASWTSTDAIVETVMGWVDEPATRPASGRWLEV